MLYSSTSNRRYTTNYLIALLSIAVMSFSAYWILLKVITQNKNTAPIIRKSSDQKMLVQRLGLLSAQLVHTKSTTTYNDLRRAIFDVFAEFNDNNNALTANNTLFDRSGIGDKAAIDNAYYREGDPSLEEQILSLRKATSDLINIPLEKMSPDSSCYQIIVASCQKEKNSLLSKLDKVSGLYEKEANKLVKKLQRGALWVLVLINLALLFAGLFIFRPMVRQIKEETHNLIDSQRLMSSVLDTVGDGIVTVDANNKIVMLNQEVCRMWSYDETSLLRKDFRFLAPIQYQSINMNVVNKYKTEGVKSFLNKKVEIVAERSNGSFFPIEIYVTETLNDQNILYTIAVNDITSRKKNQQALLEAKKDLELRVKERTNDLHLSNDALKKEIQDRKEIEKQLAMHAEELMRSNADLEQFAYVASHDLKEPLRMIASYMQLLKRQVYSKLDVENKEFVDFAVEGANRAYSLIEDLLRYAKLGQGKKIQTISIQHVIEKVKHNLTLAINEQKAKIEYHNLPIIDADSSQIYLLFQNLVSNAIKFKGDKPPVVRITYKNDDKYHLFIVDDNGIGISEKYQDKVFLIFKRLHTRNKYDGTGVGLAICKRIVEQHEGEIWFNSKLGEGTSFFFTIAKNLRV